MPYTVEHTVGQKRGTITVPVPVLVWQLDDVCRRGLEFGQNFRSTNHSNQ